MGIIIAGVVLGTILFLIFHGGNKPASGTNTDPNHDEIPPINIGWVAVFVAMMAIGAIVLFSSE